MNCLITGASMGIGASLAIKMAELGNNLFLTYYSNKKLCESLQKEIINKYNVRCYIKKCDLRNEQDVINILDECYKNLGKIDILVNNASYSNDNLLENKAKEEFEDILRVNLVGTFLMCKYAFNYINDDGIIINMSSTDGIDTYSLYNIDYAVSKAGIIQLTKSLSLIFDNIRVIAIAPNWVDTESTREMNKEYLRSELKRIGQFKLISKEEVVKQIIHTIGDKNIKSGSIIRIDGE